MLAGNNIHEIFDEFEIQSNLMRDHRVSCSRASKISMSPFFLVSQLWLYLRNSQVSVYRTIGPLVVFCAAMVIFEQGHKTCLQGFQRGLLQTSLCGHGIELEARILVLCVCLFVCLFVFNDAPTLMGH